MKIFQPTTGVGGMVIGGAVTGGTDPSVLFIQGGLLAQDPSRFGYVPGAGFSVDVDGSRGQGVLDILAASSSMGYGAYGGVFSDDQMTSISFTDQETENMVTISYSNGTNLPFTPGNTIDNPTQGITGTVVSDDGAGNLVVSSASDQWFNGDQLIEQSPGTATADIDNASVDYSLDGFIGISIFTPTNPMQIVFDKSKDRLQILHPRQIREIVTDGTTYASVRAVNSSGHAFSAFDSVSGITTNFSILSNGTQTFSDDGAGNVATLTQTQDTLDFLATDGGTTTAFLTVSNPNSEAKIGVSNASGTSQLDIMTTGMFLDTPSVLIRKTITPTGTTGDQAINTPAGSVNFAPTDASITVTNSSVNANSIIMLTPQTDASLLSVSYTATTGSFTITPNNTATTETRVDFVILN